VVLPVADSAKPGPPQWTSYLSAHPKGKVTDGVGYYDGLTVPMVKSVDTTGRTDVKVSNYDADPGPIDLIKSGDTFVGDFAIPYWYQDYAAVDQVFRSHLKKEPWESDDMPVRLITDDNVDTFEGDFVPEGDWKGEWMKLWGQGT
jgi:ABC-type sugar transport system substrate-binding protein